MSSNNLPALGTKLYQCVIYLFKANGTYHGKCQQKLFTYLNFCFAAFFQNVKMYAVQAGINKLATKFFQEISRETDGKYVNLSEFSSISDDIITLFNRESMLEIPVILLQLLFLFC